jgi:hypothetical protein
LIRKLEPGQFSGRSAVRGGIAARARQRFDVDAIDFSAPEHAAAVAKILGLVRQRERCQVTKRAMEDIVKLRLTKSGVLEAIQEHLEAQRTTYVLTQKIGIRAYVLLPCSTKPHELYVKVQVPPCQHSGGQDVLVIISAHKPKYRHKED